MALIQSMEKYPLYMYPDNGRREEQSLIMLVFKDLEVSRGFRKTKRLPKRMSLVLQLWFYDFATDVQSVVYEEHH